GLYLGKNTVWRYSFAPSRLEIAQTYDFIYELLGDYWK
ncbi:unnamed protein product, partial [marine sediment metagenome]